MSLNFEHDTLGQRVRFGANRTAENLAAEVDRLAERITLIASGAEAALAGTLTEHINVAVHHDDVAPHVPISKAEIARAVAEHHRADLLVSIGGDIAGGATGQPCWVEGTVTDTHGNPVPHARIEVWECDEDGFDDVQHTDGRVGGRARLHSDTDGRYRFWALTPVP